MNSLHGCTNSNTQILKFWILMVMATFVFGKKSAPLTSIEDYHPLEQQNHKMKVLMGLTGIAVHIFPICKTCLRG